MKKTCQIFCLAFLLFPVILSTGKSLFCSIWQKTTLLKTSRITFQDKQKKEKSLTIDHPATLPSAILKAWVRHGLKADKKNATTMPHLHIVLEDVSLGMTDAPEKEGFWIKTPLRNYTLTFSLRLHWSDIQHKAHERLISASCVKQASQEQTLLEKQDLWRGLAEEALCTLKKRLLHALPMNLQAATHPRRKKQVA